MLQTSGRLQEAVIRLKTESMLVCVVCRNYLADMFGSLIPVICPVLLGQLAAAGYVRVQGEQSQIPSDPEWPCLVDLHLEHCACWTSDCNCNTPFALFQSCLLPTDGNIWGQMSFRDKIAADYVFIFI